MGVELHTRTVVEPGGSGDDARGAIAESLNTYGITDAPRLSLTEGDDVVGAIERHARRSSTDALFVSLPTGERIARDKNHPCVVLWVVANEPESVTAEARAYFGPLAAEARRLDPTPPGRVRQCARFHTRPRRDYPICST